MNTPKLQIVLAEDDEGQAVLIQRHLKRSGFLGKITHLRDGEEALQFIHQMQTTPEALSEMIHVNGTPAFLIDINMPRASGMQALRALKGHESTSRLIAIMLTTTDDPTEIARCYHLGCTACVTKPIGSGNFASTIKNVCSFIMTSNYFEASDG